MTRRGKLTPQMVRMAFDIARRFDLTREGAAALAKETLKAKKMKGRSPEIVLRMIEATEIGGKHGR